MSSARERRRRGAACFVALYTLVALVTAAPAPALQLRGVGLHPQSSDESAAVIEQEFQMLQVAGADSVRFDVSWNSVEWRGKGQYDAPTLDWMDWVLQQAAAHRLRVILDVEGTPCWASSAPDSLKQGCSWGWWKHPITNYPPSNPQDYADFVAFAARRWGRFLAAIELWNEPNGTFLISPHPVRAYAALVKAAYPAAKSAAPGIPVLMSMGGTDTRFLSELYYLGVRGSYDGIAVHPYYDRGLSGLKSFRGYELSMGDRAPLWVTEVGWSSKDYGLAGEAAHDGYVLFQLALLPYVAAVEIYDMRDGGVDPHNGEDHFGLVDLHLHAKPAWSVFVKTLRWLASASGATKHTPLRRHRGSTPGRRCTSRTALRGRAARRSGDVTFCGTRRY